MEKNTNEDKDQNESNSNTPSKPFHPTSLASMCPVGDEFSSISLLCGWSAHIGTGENISLTNGQHHLSQLVVRPTKKKKGCPLTITSKHKSNLKHDFSRGLLVSTNAYYVSCFRRFSISHSIVHYVNFYVFRERI